MVNTFPALPLKSVVLFIACGTMVFIIVFIFAKRQITRFALRSNRGPHATIGADAPKSMRTEIERRLKLTHDIKHEPLLLSQALEDSIPNMFHGDTCHYYHRMKAVDALSELDGALRDYSALICRSVTQPLRLFLTDQRQRGPLQGLQFEVVEKFCNMYDHARHDPTLFTETEYREYMDLLRTILEHIKNQKKEANVDTDTTTYFGPEKAKDPELTPMSIPMMSSIPASLTATSSEASTVILTGSPAHQIAVQKLSHTSAPKKDPTDTSQVKDSDICVDSPRYTIPGMTVSTAGSQTLTRRTLGSKISSEQVT